MAQRIVSISQHYASSPVFIANVFRAASRPDGERIPLINPSLGEEEASLVSASTADLDEAVQCATKAWQRAYEGAGWNGATRSMFLHRLAELVQRDAQIFVDFEARYNGKPVSQLDSDVALSVWVLRFFAGFADKIYGRIQSDFADTEHGTRLAVCATRRVPVGVVGVILSYNYPLSLAAWKLGPSIATGNAVILKPGPQNPMPALHLARLCVEAGLPLGLLSVLHGGVELASAIAAHAQIDKISFTGSQAVGRRVLSSSAESNLKKVTLELGGASPVIVCGDADIDDAVEQVYWGAYSNAGQICCAGCRIYLHLSIHDAFVAKLRRRIELAVAGDPFDRRTEIGPLIDARAAQRVQDLLESARLSGASIITGATGSELDSTTRFGKGFYVKPSMVTNVDDNAPIARGEIFGPLVLILRPFEDISEALRRANDSVYGLAAGVFTRDLCVAELCTRSLVAGTIWINHYGVIVPGFPFGGARGPSGIGHDLGQEAMDQLTTVKTVITRVVGQGVGRDIV